MKKRATVICRKGKRILLVARHADDNAGVHALVGRLPMSLRNIEGMIVERGIAVDHSTVHRRPIKLLSVLEKGAFRRCKRSVGKS